MMPADVLQLFPESVTLDSREETISLFESVIGRCCTGVFNDQETAL